MNDEIKTPAAATDAVAGSSAADELTVAELVKRAQADGVSIGGEGGLLAQLTKIVLESSLEGEMDVHL
ncbi:MAG TPA: hypothetical protein VJX66_18610, partial [Amycolatopsis sp.]|nr:hypothetical protein [Amycolatopsis sp.]